MYDMISICQGRRMSIVELRSRGIRIEVSMKKQTARLQQQWVVSGVSQPLPNLVSDKTAMFHLCCVT